MIKKEFLYNIDKIISKHIHNSDTIIIQWDCKVISENDLLIFKK
jgi:hypothetical protein